MLATGYSTEMYNAFIANLLVGWLILRKDRPTVHLLLQRLYNGYFYALTPLKARYKDSKYFTPRGYLIIKNHRNLLTSLSYHLERDWALVFTFYPLAQHIVLIEYNLWRVFSYSFTWMFVFMRHRCLSWWFGTLEPQNLSGWLMKASNLSFYTHR